jgi:hypothetical protein
MTLVAQQHPLRLPAALASAQSLHVDYGNRCSSSLLPAPCDEMVC